MGTSSRIEEDIESYWDVAKLLRRPPLIDSMDLLLKLMKIGRRSKRLDEDLKIREYITTVFNTFGIRVQFESIVNHFKGVQQAYDFEVPYRNEAVLERLDKIARLWPDNL